MKSFNVFILIMAAVILTSANTGTENTYVLSKDYAVSIHGTSNLHDWDEKVVTVTGKSGVSWNNDGSFDLNAMDIKMDVHSIKSTEGAIMNNNTYKALKADNNPEITFALVEPVKSIPVGTHAITVKVNLSIAGVTNAVDMSVTATTQPHGDITFEGSKTIKMTDYGIKPPVALFGTLKTGDNITINYKTIFALTK